MLDGLWIVQILPPPLTSGGIVVFVNEKTLGGDNGFTWVGSYRSDGRTIKGRVHVENFDTEIKSALGVEGAYDMHFSGTIEGDSITGTAMIANQPQHSIAVRIDKRANI